jgi:nucleoside-diphosphate-sugar epimerase
MSSDQWELVLAVGEMALRGLRSVRLRAFNHVGPGQGESFVVAGFAAQLAHIGRGLQPPVLRVGALDRWRDFLDVRDVCAAYALALRAELPAGTVLNIASGTPRRIGDVLDALLAHMHIRPKVEVEAARMRPTDVERVQGDAARAKNALGWVPRIPWHETLNAVVEDAQKRAETR